MAASLSQAAVISMAHVLLDQQRYAQAVSRLREGLILAKGLRDQRLMSSVLGDFAMIIGRHGQPGMAARLYGTADAMSRTLTISHLTGFEHVERQVDFIRGMLGEAAFNAAYSEGQAIALDQALETALEAIEVLDLSQETPA